MKKIIKFLLTAIISAAAIIAAVRFAGEAYSKSMDKYVGNINADVEAKRQELLATGVFHDGVTVNGVSIGGMSFEEAKEALKTVEADLIKDVGFTLRYGIRGVLEIDKSYFSFSYDTEDVLSEAIMLASEGELEALRQEIDDIRENGRQYTITSTIVPDEARIVNAVREAGESLNVDPVNATMQPNPESVFDPEAERFTYDAGATGYEANTEDAVDEIIDRARNHEYGTVYMDGTIIEPEVQLSDLIGSVVMRSHYESSYASGAYANPNRVFNIIKACGYVNGYVLPPKNQEDSSDKSDVFSINTVLGPRTTEGGWKMAPGFVQGGADSVDSPGGGVCHVSSTLYNAVITADLHIVYRINHSSHVGYVPWGLDATIDTRGPDFKFSNNTDSDIYIFMWVDETRKLVCAEIWGDPFPDTFDEIRFYAELVETIEPTGTEYIQTSYLSAPYWYVNNGAKTGYKYQSYKRYYKDGRAVTQPIPVALSEYRMHPRRIYVWRGFDPSVDYLDPAYQIPKPSPNP